MVVMFSDRVQFTDWASRTDCLPDEIQVLERQYMCYLSLGGLRSLWEMLGSATECSSGRSHISQYLCNRSFLGLSGYNCIPFMPSRYAVTRNLQDIFNHNFTVNGMKPSPFPL